MLKSFGSEGHKGFDRSCRGMYGSATLQGVGDQARQASAGVADGAGAAAGIGVNPVSAFHHDHLFVPEARAEEAMTILREISSDTSPPP